jgi:hypothetical protein
MSEHKHGEMDISAQEKTFAGFMKVGAISVVLALLALIFMGLVNA